MSQFEGKEVNESLLSTKEKPCILCVSRNQSPSTSLPQWPNIELTSMMTNEEQITNESSHIQLVSDEKNGQIDKKVAYSDFIETDMTHTKIATLVDQVYYHYGKGKKSVNALNGIDIKVPEGTIYGILGPSGCGKTTLVHCIVGSLKPKKGLIKVFGYKPGSFYSCIPGPGVGYMPQEIGLFAEFTIEETLTFFGRLYRLPQPVIRQSIKFLLNFLDLPNKSRIIGNLSGGQKRRVSLAAALVHKPPLLVLDEPTVGIDPVLRQSIWKHLTALSRDGITVIITTHYIEEARAANTVAFMRQGKLLEEGNPQWLLKKFGFSTLEEIFLRLCRKEPSSANDSSNCSTSSEVSKDKELKHIDITIIDSNNKLLIKDNGHVPDRNDLNHIIMAQPKQFEKRNRFADHLARTSALFWKNATRMIRNLPVLVFTLLVPSIQGVLFFFCVGRDPYNIPVAILNQENPAEFSSQFLQLINNDTIHQIHYETLDDGLDSVKHGKTRGLIAIGSNFTQAMSERGISGVNIDEETISMSNINLYLDMTTQFAALKITKTIHEAFREFAKNLLKSMEMNEALADPPIHIHPPVLGTQDPPVTEFMAPGFILSLLFLSAIAPTALTLVLERKDGLLERSLVAGVHPYEYIMSHVLTQVIVVIIQVILMLVLSFVIFGIPCRGSIFWAALLIVMQGVCGMTYGLLVSAVCREENSAFILCMGSMFPQFLMSGTVWPIETMPKVLIIISSIFPQGVSIDAMRSILYRGWGPGYFEVALGYIISGAWTFVFLLSASIIFGMKRTS